MSALIATLAAAALAHCTAIDGDTIRCGRESVRLLGIDAPELGACRPGRRCVEGDGNAAREVMREALTFGPLTIERVGQDSYGRTLGVVYVAGRNLSCLMIGAGQAIYRADWDNGGRVAHDCPDWAR
jgi:micrococcal nuclease